MVQTKVGGQKVKASNYAKYGPDYYRRIGAMGGRVSKGGGFASNRELTRIAGAKGGRISKRRPGPNSKKASPIPTLPVSVSEQNQLSDLAEALQHEMNVVSYEY